VSFEEAINMSSPYCNQSYTAPVSQLLDAEVCEDKSLGRGWPNYVRDFGLTVEHGPELIQMMGDLQLWNVDLDDPACDAPIRAWQALAQLQYLDAIDTPSESYSPDSQQLNCRGEVSSPV
jgi:hypothetical protein